MTAFLKNHSFASSSTSTCRTCRRKGFVQVSLVGRRPERPSRFIPASHLKAQLSKVDGWVSTSRWASREMEEHHFPPSPPQPKADPLSRHPTSHRWRSGARGRGRWDTGGSGQGSWGGPGPWEGVEGGTREGWLPLFSLAAWRGGPGLSEGLTDLKFWRLNERNTQLTKQCATEEVSSGLAKSLLSFHLFSPNNSCPLIPCYSAVKNKTSLWLSVFLFFPRVGLITGD